MERNAVKVRFAPSPTGMLHLGGARTALFNYLFARYHGGKFILRVEDTDRVRSSEEFERLQLEDLQWLGLRFDEGPYRQSERGGFYEEAAGRLLEAGLAYEAGDEAGRRALYFRPSVRSGIFRDALRGEIRFVGVEDFVIFKSDGSPAYNFAAVVDDATMRISHVIRGEEHLPNTARQALLYRAISLYLAGRTRRARRSLRTLTSSRENGTHRASARAPLPSTLTASSSLMPDTSGRCHSESCTSASSLAGDHGPGRPYGLCRDTAGVERGGLLLRCWGSGRSRDRGPGERTNSRPGAATLGEGERGRAARALAPSQARPHGS